MTGVQTCALPIYYKENYGDRLTLLGNVSCARTLVYGTKEEIEEETRRVIEIGAPGGGFVLSSSNTIHSQVPADKYLLMLETAKKYGGYPIKKRSDLRLPALDWQENGN